MHKTNNNSDGSGYASPTFASQRPAEENKNEGEKREEDDVPVWIEGTEEDLNQDSGDKGTKLSFDELEDRNDLSLREKAEEDKERFVIVKEVSASGLNDTPTKNEETKSALNTRTYRKRENNHLLDQINHLRHISYRHIEQS